METLFLKLDDEPEVVDVVLRHVVDYYVAVTERVFAAAGDAIDIFFIGNDFGGQTGPLMGADLFRRFMFQHLQRLCRLGPWGASTPVSLMLSFDEPAGFANGPWSNGLCGFKP
jgi:hypothetical protein